MAPDPVDFVIETPDLSSCHNRVNGLPVDQSMLLSEKLKTSELDAYLDEIRRAQLNKSSLPSTNGGLMSAKKRKEFEELASKKTERLDASINQLASMIRDYYTKALAYGFTQQETKQTLYKKLQPVLNDLLETTFELQPYEDFVVFANRKRSQAKKSQIEMNYDQLNQMAKFLYESAPANGTARSRNFDLADPQQVGIDLRALREHLKIGKRELARQLGVYHNAVAQIENGIYTPKYEKIYEFLEGLDAVRRSMTRG